MNTEEHNKSTAGYLGLIAFAIIILSSIYSFEIKAFVNILLHSNKIANACSHELQIAESLKSLDRFSFTHVRLGDEHSCTINIKVSHRQTVEIGIDSNRIIILTNLTDKSLLPSDDLTDLNVQIKRLRSSSESPKHFWIDIMDLEEEKQPEQLLLWYFKHVY